MAVIGPNADNVDVQYGNYNGSPVNPVSVLDGIKEKLGEQAQVKFALGTPHHDGLPYLVSVPKGVLFTDSQGSKPGLSASFYPNLEASGDAVLKRTDATVDYYWWDGEPPVDGLVDDNYSVSWSGYLVPRSSGKHAIGVEGKYFSFIFEGDTLLGNNNIHHPNKTYQWIDLEAGKAYRMEVVMKDQHGDAPIIIHWDEPNPARSREAVQLARWADHVVLVMGLTARLEGEEMRGLDLDGFYRGDRTSLDLPETQSKLIRQIVAAGKPVTLVLMTGSAVSINWEDEHIPSILQAWYGGESAGSAVADVLFGDYNPAGRLPLTFYKSVDDLPDFENYDMEGRTYRYFNGEVLYPFGYGLSYSDFTYNNLILEREETTQDEELTISVEVTNEGAYDGEEVVQMYIRKPGSEVLRPIKDLRGFERVFINKGQTRVVTMILGPDELEVYNLETGEYQVEKGLYEILLGSSSDDGDLIQASLLVR
ncbi:MAG: glycoside hydrolase family 3 C-terminal domain-containing protein [Bacteroides sp.]|nr:glycoside hydrolase family 3 C-terminal domain-containing protein [Bacteroides sp.]